MKIDISQKLCPFSHQPGTSCLIPFSTWSVQVFPTLLRFSNLSNISTSERKEIVLPFQGPIKEFTVVQDLEKGEIRVFGHAEQGYFRYFIFKAEEGIFLKFEKRPFALMSQLQNQVCIVEQKQSTCWPSNEKLSLGMHKSLDWELVCRRQDLKEIFPVWLKLADQIPYHGNPLRYQGTAMLIETCEKKMKAAAKNELEVSFLNVFNAAFYGIFTPRLFDDHYQGLIPISESEKPDFSPLDILIHSAKLIRTLFFKEAKDTFSFLPLLPPSFHSGRFINIQTTQGELIHIEWSKKLLRRVIIKTHVQREITLCLQKPIQSFRMRNHLKERGKISDPKQPLLLLPNRVLYLDRFQK